MAKMFPDLSKQQVVFASKAEERVYQLLSEQLPDSWRVFYSVTLSAQEVDQGLVDNEIDFVLYHPSFGAIALEVKGGRIGYDSEAQSFYSVDRHDNSYKIKNPFLQALTWKSRFVRFLKRQGLKMPVTHAVAFPSVVESEMALPASMDASVMLGRNALNQAESFLKGLVQKAHPEKFLRFDDCGTQLVHLINGMHFVTRLHLRDYMDYHETRLRDIENIQEAFLTPVMGSHRLGIEGEAGTGKTLLGSLLAEHCAATGLSVLFLTSNDLLNDFLKTKLPKAICIKTYVEWAEGFGVSLLKAPRDYAGKRDDWVQFEAPELLQKRVAESSSRYDVIICDEAQDAKPFWWDGIQAALTDDPERQRLYIFFDRSQGVFATGDGEKFVPEDTLPVQQPYFPLVNNYRMTAQIAAFARQFRTGGKVLPSHSHRLGFVPELIIYNDEIDLEQKLHRLAEYLIECEGLRGDEITLLSARKVQIPESSIKGLEKFGSLKLNQAKSSRSSAKKQPLERSDMVMVSTVAAFKGLETSVGIIVNLSEYNLPLNHPLMSSLLYVAASRAKHMLYVCIKKDDAKEALLRKALETVNVPGSFVVDPREEANELIGTVTHFNPDRLGLIKIDTSDVARSSVLFFPHDISIATIKSLGVGTKLRFRPRMEGECIIAVDLKLA